MRLSLHHRISKQRHSNIINNLIPQFEDDIKKLFYSITEKQTNGYESSQLIHYDDKTLQLIKYILIKPSKHPMEISIVKIYLMNLEKFMKIFSNLPESFSLEDLIIKISGQLKCEQIEANKIICKLGDKGDKFYLVLKGKIAIMIPKEYPAKLSELDFVKYLINLWLHHEYDTFVKVLLINRNKIIIEERDITVLFSVFKLYKFYIENIGNRYRYLFNFIMNEDDVRSSIDTKFECKSSSIVQGFLLNEIELNEVFDYYSKVYDMILGNEMKQGMRKGVNLEKLTKKEAYEVLLFNDSINNDYIYTGSAEEYCQRFILDISNSRPGYTEMRVFTYIEVISLGEGNIFGEIALQKATQKRTATVITKEECVFGTLTKTTYDLCLKNTQDRVRLWNVFYFLNGPIFKDINQTIFETKYFNFFKQEEFCRGEEIFLHNQTMSTIFFIKQGELEVSVKLSYNQLNKIIRHMGGYLDESKEKQFSYDYPQFNLYYNHMIHNFRICILKENEIAGLDDFMINNKFFCDCRVSSTKVNMFSLEKAFYPNLIAEKQIHNNVNNHVKRKRSVLLDLLISIRQTKIKNEMKKIVFDKDKEITTFERHNKIIKLNKVKTSNSILGSMKNFTIIKPDAIIAKEINISPIERTRNTPKFDQGQSLSPTERYRELTQRSVTLGNTLLREKLGKQLKIPLNTKMINKLSSKKKLCNTSLTKILSPRIPNITPYRSTMTMTNEKDHSIENSMKTAVNTIQSIPMTISRTKKVMIPFNSRCMKEYTTTYYESRRHHKTFYYNNLHVFDNLLCKTLDNNKDKTKINLSKPKNIKCGVIDCLVLDKWEENNNTMRFSN